MNEPPPPHLAVVKELVDDAATEAGGAGGSSGSSGRWRHVWKHRHALAARLRRRKTTAKLAAGAAAGGSPETDKEPASQSVAHQVSPSSVMEAGLEE